MKIHHNLVLLRGPVELLSELTRDKGMARLIVAQPAGDVCLVRRRDHQRLRARLEKLGHTPLERGTC